jgi:hypothetical protein
MSEGSEGPARQRRLFAVEFWGETNVKPEIFDSGLCYHILRAGTERRMKKAHQATLHAVFAKPTRANIRWSAIEAMIRALGGEIAEREGSRVAARLNGVIAVFHRPHPRPETKKGAVEAVRQFLENAGVKP